uniref:uncharacterized protein LOC105351852 n=1 Tax=Fragaria vesca subsp. vesca TaxID=101020 RepID=UPI0005CAE0BA|nr:PREDICTED: uncharacterized protein LOC105351852 [Fragaria vesca subsp. vesca]
MFLVSVKKEVKKYSDDAILNSGICNIRPSLKQKSTWQRFSKLFYAPEIMTVAASTSETPMVQMSLKLTEEREAKAMRNASKSKETWCLLLSSKCKMLFEILKNLFIS